LDLLPVKIWIGGLKFQFSVTDAVKAIAKFNENRMKAFDQLSDELRLTFEESLNQLLNLEMSLFLGEPDQADNKKNGHKVRDNTLKNIGTVRINLPQDRKSRFEISFIKKSERVDPRIRGDIAILHLAVRLFPSSSSNSNSPPLKSSCVFLSQTI
jgi:hypothetical protein